VSNEFLKYNNANMDEIQEQNSDIQNDSNTSSKRTGSFGELVRFIFIALIIVIPIRLFVAEPFIVSGASMDPTFETGQYLVIDRISYQFEDPKRGDVIVFRYPNDTKKFFIKRIIGLPEETVLIENGLTSIKKADGQIMELTEVYVKHPLGGNSTIALSDHQYFVMGDNRAQSSDSRIWGPLDTDLIIGRALFRFTPLDKIGIFPGQHDFENIIRLVQ